jgi:indole-3-glycerol phosphate synthase
MTEPPAFESALRSSSVAIIAEIKRSSPSKGVINSAIAVDEQLHAYERGGAAAVSVLTEPSRFSGSNEDLSRARAVARVPLLKKDFHVEPVQLVEARALGASAALVIVRAVSPEQLSALLETARRINLEVLVEVRDDRELERALACGARIVGVNNRNLETLAIDPTTAVRLIPQIPREVVAVAESGVNVLDDVRRLAEAGADAVLVGSAISSAVDPESAVRSLAGVERSTSARKS